MEDRGGEGSLVGGSRLREVEKMGNVIQLHRNVRPMNVGHLREALQGVPDSAQIEIAFDACGDEENDGETLCGSLDNVSLGDPKLVTLFVVESH